MPDGLQHIAELAEFLRQVPDEEREMFRALFEVMTWDPASPLGRSSVACAVLEALDRGDREPGDVLNVFDSAIKLAGTPAASTMPLQQRLAALPRRTGHG